MKFLHLVFLTAFVGVMLASCDHSKKPKDSYYTDHGDWDDVRFPLIKPYEAICLNGSKDWYVQLTQGSEGLFSAPGTKEIAIVDSVIFLHSTNTILNYTDAKEAWFILIPKKHIEKGFAGFFEYQDYLHSLGFEHEPKLYPMDKVSQYFGDHDIIDWRNVE
jgi:hypothetical protein